MQSNPVGQSNPTMTESMARSTAHNRLGEKAKEIWNEVLEADESSATFFELNGDSISAIRLTTRIEEELDVVLDIGEIFEEDPDLATLISWIVEKAAR